VSLEAREGLEALATQESSLPGMSMAITAAIEPSRIAISAILNEGGKPATLIQSTTAPEPNPGARNSRSARLPAAPPSTTAQKSLAMPFLMRRVKTATTTSMAAATRVITSG
jgi:hypothetical protein